MKKNLPFLTIILISISLYSCHFQLYSGNFIIENKTTEDLSVCLYERYIGEGKHTPKCQKIDIPKGSAVRVLQKKATGSARFRDIVNIDSLTLSGRDFSTTWVKPSSIYIDSVDSLGTPKNFYNRKNWTSKDYKKHTDFIFTLTDADVEAFKQ